MLTQAPSWLAGQEEEDEKRVQPGFNFVVYNLRNYLPMDRRIDGELIPDAPKPEEEIEALVAVIREAQPDVLGVCEVGPRPYLADLQRRLSAVGLSLPHLHLVTSASGYQRNLGLLSRFPIVDEASRDDLTYQLGDKTLPFQRGILDVTLQIEPDYQLRCLGLHLKSKRDVPEGDQALMRRNEAELARHHAEAIMREAPDTNLLVFGDLNDTRNEPPVRALQGRFGSSDRLESIMLSDSRDERWTHHWAWADLYARIDFVLFNAALKPELDFDRCRIIDHELWDAASDHRALSVRIVPSGAD